MTYFKEFKLNSCGEPVTAAGTWGTRNRITAVANEGVRASQIEVVTSSIGKT